MEKPNILDVINTLKIYKVCDSLGIDIKDALVFAWIHRVTQCGKLGPESLEHLATEAQLSTQGENNPRIEHYLEEAQKIMTDPAYRLEKYEFYVNEIKPRLADYSLIDALRVLRRN